MVGVGILLRWKMLLKGNCGENPKRRSYRCAAHDSSPFERQSSTGRKSLMRSGASKSGGRPDHSNLTGMRA
jgi:hypothetical protein